MERKIETAIIENDMASAHAKIIIGFSGGADSSALLHYFKDRAQSVVCVHINHMIRGDEAQRDEDFCRSVCEKYGVELVCHKIDIPALARQRGLGLEQTAREERYRVFYEELSSRSFDAILTAHNANDNAESIIFNLIRGSGANGMAGIKPVNGSVLRPLILVTRAEILEYCEKNGIEYVTDSTNSDTEYTRNFIRHEIAPMMSRLNPEIESACSRLSASLRSDEDFILSEAHRFIKEHCQDGKINTNALDRLHDSVKARVLKVLAQENLDYKSIKTCIDFLKSSKCGDVINLCKGVSLKRERDYASFIKTRELIKQSFEVKLEKGLNDIDQIGVTIAYMCDDEPSDMELYQALCLKDVTGALFARSKHDGDTIRHGKMTKKVKKLMCEKKIPSHLRDKIPIICDDIGIVAIPEVAIRDGAKGRDTDIVLRLYRRKND